MDFIEKIVPQYVKSLPTFMVLYISYAIDSQGSSGLTCINVVITTPTQ